MKQLLRNMYVDNKRILLRCDFNVPIVGGNITDESKIIKSLETINYLLERNCKIIILSHLGRVKTEEDKTKYSLMIVKNSLERLLNKPVKFANDSDTLNEVLFIKGLVDKHYQEENALLKRVN